MSADGQSKEQSPLDAGTIEAISARAKLEYDAILAIATSIKSLADSATESQRLASSAHADIAAKLNELSGLASAASAAMTKINDAQSVIATKSEHIQGAQEHADKVRADLDKVLTAAKQSATESDASKKESVVSASSAAEALASVRATKGNVESESAAIEKARSSAEESEKLLKKLAGKADEVDRKLATYEKTLADLKAKSDSQLQSITDLLPSATSAGLAHAFDHRRKSFIDPGKRWQWLFVGAVLSLVVLAATGLWHVYSETSTLTYEQLLLLWLARLPIAGALVWLAIHAGRESALAKRLEEDYGYKAAVAASFQGFHKQMSEVGATSAQNAPLSKLCEDTLVTLASPPGRIYDKHSLTTTPSAELAKAAKAAKGLATGNSN